MAEQTTFDLPNEKLESLRRGGWMLRACMWLYIILTTYIMGISKPIEYYGVDYDKHWYAARALLEGKSVYLGGASLWMGFNYPQAAALPFFWLGFFSVQTSQYLWKAVLLALSVGCWWMAWRQYRPGAAAHDPAAPVASLVRAGVARHWGLVTAFMTSGYFALSSCIYLGNIDPVNGFLAVGMVAAMLSGAPLAAGIFWALLTLVKMMPLMLIVPILFWRQWRVLQGFLGTMVVYFFILVALGRVGEEWYFAREAIPVIPVWWRCITISPISFALHACGLAQWVDNPRIFAIVVRVSEAVLLPVYVGLIALLARRKMDLLRVMEIAAVFYPLLSPLLEYHHFVWCMPAFYLQARRFVQGRMKTGTAAALVIGWAMLCSTYHIVDLTPKNIGLGEFIHFAALPGYLTVLTATLIEALRWRPEGTQEAEARESDRVAVAVSEMGEAR